MIVNIGLGQLDNVVDLGIHVDKDKTATVLLGKVIDGDGYAPSVAASDHEPHLAGLLLEMRHSKLTAILDRTPRARDVLEAQLVVARRRCGRVHKEGALLRDGVPPNREKEGLQEHANLRTEECVLSGQEVYLVDGDQSHGAMSGAEDDGVEEGGVKNKGVQRSKQINRP